MPEHLVRGASDADATEPCRTLAFPLGAPAALGPRLGRQRATATPERPVPAGTTATWTRPAPRRSRSATRPPGTPQRSARTAVRSRVDGVPGGPGGYPPQSRWRRRPSAPAAT